MILQIVTLDSSYLGTRAYPYWFEQYLQDAQGDSTITVPWWDWTSDDSRTEGTPKIYSDENVNGNPNPLYSFHVVLPDGDNFIDQRMCSKTKVYETYRSSALQLAFLF
jgi:hypothetical protein